MQYSKDQIVQIRGELAALQSDLDELKEFVKSPLWARLKSVYESRLAEIDRDLRIADDIKRVKFLQGEGTAVNFFILYPQVMLEKLPLEINNIRAQLDLQKDPTDGN